MAGTEQLASWNEGPAKSAIIEFVEKTVAAGVPPEERIATFDADGTLWCEKPVPVQVDFLLRRLSAMAQSDPSLRERQPWRAAYSKDGAWFDQVIKDHYAGDDTNVKVLLDGFTAAYAGIGVEDFEARAAAFLRSTQHPTLGRGYLDTAYVPMVELLAYLRANGFENRIVSGSGGDFMRSISAETFGIPLGHVIGSAGVLTYKDGMVTRQAQLRFLDDGPEKPIQIWTQVGRRPLLAAGNSNGDIPMLEFAEHQARPSLCLLVLHDDSEREFAYTSGAEKALEDADNNSGWTVVSMKNDFGTVFAPGPTAVVEDHVTMT